MGNDQFDGRPGCIHGSPSLRSSVTVGDGAQGEVTIRLDHRSVRKSAVTVFILAGVFLLALWLYSEISHFLFLIILAWLFAIALEPGIRALIKRGRSRGTGAAVMGGGAIVIGVVLGGWCRTTAFGGHAQTRQIAWRGDGHTSLRTDRRTKSGRRETAVMHCPMSAPRKTPPT